MLADNVRLLPKESREFARRLIANAVHRELTEKELRQVAKLVERIKREKLRLRKMTPEPLTSGADGSKTVARRTTESGLPRDAAKPKRSPKDRCAAVGARSAS